MAAKKGALRPLEFAEGYSLSRTEGKARLLAAMRQAGVKVYWIEGRQFVDSLEWQRGLRKLATREVQT